VRQGAALPDDHVTADRAGPKLAGQGALVPDALEISTAASLDARLARASAARADLRALREATDSNSVSAPWAWPERPSARLQAWLPQALE